MLIREVETIKPIKPLSPDQARQKLELGRIN
jgi:hypothetical protein